MGAKRHYIFRRACLPERQPFYNLALELKADAEFVRLKLHKNPSNHTTIMADREDKVYQAKLAEQAERYDGKFNVIYNNNATANYFIKRERNFRRLKTNVTQISSQGKYCDKC